MATIVVVADDGTEVVIGHVSTREPGLAVVDVLARLTLYARRSGRRLALRGATAELRGLLELCGLDGALAVEPLGEPEVRKELGVDEVVQPADPPA